MKEQLRKREWRPTNDVMMAMEGRKKRGYDSCGERDVSGECRMRIRERGASLEMRGVGENEWVWRVWV